MSDMQIGRTTVTSAVQTHVDTDGTAASEAGGSLLSQPVDLGGYGGDDLAELASLLTRADQRDRATSRTLQATEYFAEAKEDAAKVQAMHDKADHIRAEGWTTGLAEIGSGACGLFAGTTTQVPGKLDPNDGWKAGAAALEAIGKVGGAQFKADQTEDDAKAAVHESAAKSADRFAQQCHQDELDSQEALKKVAEFLRGVREAQNGALSAAASYRG
jgi:hypothetical protein